MFVFYYVLVSDVQGITDVKGQFIHVAARQSPYPGTSIARFPVFDKYVPWEVRVVCIALLIVSIVHAGNHLSCLWYT